LLSTILRILQPSSGSIIIDSILTSKIPLSTLRQRIITIPQDFVHIPGTIRLNLDLFTQASDDDINGVLKKIGLLEVLTSQGDLDSSFSPEKLSKGQKQLLAFARAMIQRQAQNTGLILLDEMTSSMDNETERRINGIIKSEFHGCTLIMVSHNVEMIMQMDIMVVMDTGKLVYFGKPDESKLQMGY
jgi:ABC-type multidrug transport system fused ATPase/permease subunit